MQNLRHINIFLVSDRPTVIVITFYSLSCLGQETANEPFDLRDKLPLAHLSTTHVGGFTLSLWLLNVKQGSCEYLVFIVFGLTRLGIEPESTTSVADAISTWPLISYKLFWENLSTCWLNRILKGTLTCTQVALLHPWIKHNYFC